MTDPVPPNPSATHPLENILRLCAAAAPEPWYPSDYARTSGTSRDDLDLHLNRLRLGGLIRLTDWVKDRGQGYMLTPDGTRVLENPRELDQLKNGRMPEARPPEVVASPLVERRTWDRSGTLLNDLQRPMRPVVTNLLLAVNIVWFLAGMAVARSEGVPVNLYFRGPSQEERATEMGHRLNAVYNQIGALYGGDLVRGEWWRLLTCCFVHFGALHLGVNMLTLYWVGPMTERMWGRGRYLAIYLIAGWGGSCVVMIAGPMTQVAGASGALWGIVASTAVWILMNRAFLPPALSSGWLRNLLFIFILNAFFSMSPGVSASAHFGGGAVGAVAGFLANFHRFGSPRQRLAGLAGLILLPVVCFAAVIGDVAYDQRWARLALPVEIRSFQEEGADFAWSAGNEALDAYKKTLPLIVNYRPERRDPEEVKKARALLAEQQTEVETAAARLTHAGPFRSKTVENARQVGLAYMQSLTELFRKVETCLNGGENWKTDEKNLLAQAKEAVQARAAWVEALSQAGLLAR